MGKSFANVLAVAAIIAAATINALTVRTIKFLPGAFYPGGVLSAQQDGSVTSTPGFTYNSSTQAATLAGVLTVGSCVGCGGGGGAGGGWSDSGTFLFPTTGTRGVVMFNGTTSTYFEATSTSQDSKFQGISFTNASGTSASTTNLKIIGGAQAFPLSVVSAPGSGSPAQLELFNPVNGGTTGYSGAYWHNGATGRDITDGGTIFWNSPASSFFISNQETNGRIDIRAGGTSGPIWMFNGTSTLVGNAPNTFIIGTPVNNLLSINSVNAAFTSVSSTNATTTNLDATIARVGGVNVCLQDGTNCPASGGSQGLNNVINVNPLATSTPTFFEGFIAGGKNNVTGTLGINTASTTAGSYFEYVDRTGTDINVEITSSTFALNETPMNPKAITNGGTFFQPNRVPSVGFGTSSPMSSSVPYPQVLIATTTAGTSNLYHALSIQTNQLTERAMLTFMNRTSGYVPNGDGVAIYISGTATPQAVLMNYETSGDVQLGSGAAAVVQYGGTRKAWEPVVDMARLLGSNTNRWTAGFMGGIEATTGTILSVTSTNIAVTGTLMVTGSNTSTFAGPVSSTRLTISNAPAAGTGLNPLCYDTGSGGGVTIGSAGVCPVSALAVKENIKKISYGLSEVIALDYYDYTFKGGLNDGRTHSGVVADWAEKTMPNLVLYNEKGEVNGWDQFSFSASLGQAIKELATCSVSSPLCNRVSQLERENEDLNKRVQRLETLLKH